MKRNYIFHKFVMRAYFNIGMSIVLLMCLFSCTTERKATNWMITHPDVLSSICAAEYPVKTEYIKGEEITRIDTTIIQGYSIPCPEVKQGVDKVYVKCPPSKTIIKEITRIDTIIKENTAKVSSLGYQLSKQIKLAEEEEHKRKKLQTILLIAVALIIVETFFLVSRR